MFDPSEHTYLEVNREGGTDILHNYRHDKLSFWSSLRPQLLAQLQSLVVDVKRNSSQYDAFLQNPHAGSSGTNGGGSSGNGVRESEEDEEKDYKKYFLVMWILAGVGILLAIGIVILLIITYRAKKEAYVFEGTKL